MTPQQARGLLILILAEFSDWPTALLQDQADEQLHATLESLANSGLIAGHYATRAREARALMRVRHEA